MSDDKQFMHINITMQNLVQVNNSQEKKSTEKISLSVFLPVSVMPESLPNNHLIVLCHLCSGLNYSGGAEITTTSYRRVKSIKVCTKLSQNDNIKVLKIVILRSPSYINIQIFHYCFADLIALLILLYIKGVMLYIQHIYNVRDKAPNNPNNYQSCYSTGDHLKINNKNTNKYYILIVLDYPKKEKIQYNF